MKKLYPHPILAREGWFFIALTLALSIAATWFFCWWSIPFWIVCIFVIQFFRDPARVRPTDEGVVLSPADGRIVVVENAINEYTQEEALKISVFMNVFNVHSNRAPVAGTVLKVEYTPGRFFNADLDKASKENERNAVIVQSGAHTITFVQIAGLVARRILCYIRPNDTLEAGQRYGFIRFGSRVDVYLPKGSIPRVTIGDKVKATSTILADLPNNAERS